MQHIDAVVDNELLVISDGTKETTVATAHNGTDSYAHIHDIFPNDNSISITKSDSADSANVCYSPSWSLTGETDARQNRSHDDLSRDIEYNVLQSNLPTSLKFNRNTMSIFVKRRPTTNTDEPMAMQQMPTLSRHSQSNFSDDSENIVCSPNFNQSIENVFMIGDVATTSADALASTAGVADSNEPNGSSSNIERLHLRGRCIDDNYTKPYQSIEDDDELLKATERRSERLMELLQFKDPMRNAVVLRSPRGNQPRSYTTDALYAALMDVKSGESIYRLVLILFFNNSLHFLQFLSKIMKVIHKIIQFKSLCMMNICLDCTINRASQIHGVPRKTLRNWMKRWHIKSVYPMPYQLKKAAEKKRLIVQQHESPQLPTSTQTKSEIIDTNEFNE